MQVVLWEVSNQQRLSKWAFGITTLEFYTEAVIFALGQLINPL
jgi:hypothetical protein